MMSLVEVEDDEDGLCNSPGSSVHKDRVEVNIMVWRQNRTSNRSTL